MIYRKNASIHTHTGDMRYIDCTIIGSNVYIYLNTLHTIEVIRFYSVE